MDARAAPTVLPAHPAERSREQAALFPRATKDSIDIVRQNAPAELLALSTWVASSREPREDGRSSKKPLNPKTGGNAKSNDPTTWSSFEDAAAFALRDERVFGVGVNVHDTDYVALDLDHVLDTSTGAIVPAAAEFLNDLSPTYCEVSPSGDGLRMFLRGTLPRPRREHRSAAFGPGTKLEVYDRVSTRYVTVTGRVLSERHEIADLTPSDVGLLLERLDPRRSGSEPAERVAEPADDAASDLDRVPAALAALGADYFDDYHRWIDVGTSLRPLGDAGLQFWIDWSRQSSKFDERACRRRWPGFNGLRTIRSLFWMADQATDKAWRDSAPRRRLPQVDFSALLTGPDTRGLAPLQEAEACRPFPVDALPPIVRDFVVHGAAAQGVDVAFWAVPLLGVLAGSTGATRRVQIKATWQEPCVLWPAVLSPSGMGKSPSLRALIQPLRDRDLRLHEATEYKRQQYERELAEWKERGGGVERPRPPEVLACLIDDATIEAIAVRLVGNRRGLLLAVDELAGWVRSFDKYRKGGGDAQRWLSIHGACDFPVDRKGGNGQPGRLYVRTPCVSVVGTIQPGTARHCLGSTDSRETGLAARLLLAQPRIVPAKWTDAEIPGSVEVGYSSVVNGLLDLSMPDEPIALPLTDAARNLFVAWHDWNGQATYDAHHDGDGDVAAALSKLRGGAARLALVLALTRAAEEGFAETLREVDETSMAAGIRLAQWFEAEAHRIYAQWQGDDAADAAMDESGSLKLLAAKMLEAIKAGPRTMSDLHGLVGRNIPADRIRAALALLGSQVVCERVPRPGGGRPAELWRLAEGVSS